MNAGVGAGLAYGLLRGDRSEARNTAVKLATHLPMAIAGVSVDVLHRERLWTHRPAIFVANHQSALDIPVLGRCSSVTSPSWRRRRRGGTRAPSSGRW